MSNRLSAMSSQLSCPSLSGCRASDTTQCRRRVELPLLPCRPMRLRKSKLKAELRVARLQRCRLGVEFETWLSPTFRDDTLFGLSWADVQVRSLIASLPIRRTRRCRIDSENRKYSR